MEEATEEHNDEVKSPASSERKDVNTSSNLVTTNIHNSFNNINLFDEKQLVTAENFITKVMRSEKGGIKTVNDGLAVLMRAQALDLPFATCLEHIHVINGKTGIDIHIVKALLLKAGCTWRCLKDYQPLYEYTDGINVYIDNNFPEYAVRCNNQKEAEEKAKADEQSNKHDFVYVYPVKYYKDFNNNIYRDYQLNNKFAIATNRQHAAEIAKTGHIPVYRIPNVAVDYITEYELTRNINGKDVTAIGKFTQNEAIAADFFSKDNYKKYPRVMISHRAFTLAARDIASDILLGAMETTELKIVAGKDLSDSDTSDIEDAEIINI